MRISLKGSLALWYVLTIPALVFALAFTAQHIIVASLRAELDNSLEKRAELVASTTVLITSGSSETYPDVFDRLNEQELSSIPLLVRVSDPQGRILATFGDIPDLLVPQLDSLLAVTDTAKGRFHTIKALRVYTVAVTDASTKEVLAVIQAGDGLTHVAAAQDRLWKYAIVEGTAGSLLILAIGMFILHRGFRPLDRILKRVHEIGSSNLQTGLPDEPRPPELQELANSLNAMWRRLDETFRARETFVASVSHDLRTPLTALQGQIDVLLLRPSIDQEVKQSLARMAKEARRLVRMTNNLLLNSELESNPALAIEEVNLAGLLEEVLGEVWTLAEGLDLGLQADENALVHGDRDLLKQMVLNIAENAIKFTPKGGHVMLTLGQQDGWAIIEVADSGVGITLEDLPHVMEPFYKAGSSRRVAGRGAGLGLAIVKRVVELHEGQIEIHSQEGAGTTVRVRLPMLPQMDQMQALEDSLPDPGIPASGKLLPEPIETAPRFQSHTAL